MKNHLIPRNDGLCYSCWLPAKIGCDWLHKDASCFGTCECTNPKWIGRLLFLMSKQIARGFNLAPFSSQQAFADWLSSPSSNADYGGIANAVFALLFVNEKANERLKQMV